METLFDFDTLILSSRLQSLVHSSYFLIFNLLKFDLFSFSRQNKTLKCFFSKPAEGNKKNKK